MRGEQPFERALLAEAGLYAEQDIETRFGTAAVRVDPRQQLVELEDGTEQRYDRLPLATGARSRRLPVSGTEVRKAMRLVRGGLAADPHRLRDEDVDLLQLARELTAS